MLLLSSLSRDSFCFTLKGAESINEALDRFYETPNNNSNRPISRMANHRGLNEEIDTRDDAPPAYASLNTVSESQRRSHTNKVIEAANIRARDEVQSAPFRDSSRHELMSFGFVARDVEHATERST